MIRFNTYLTPNVCTDTSICQLTPFNSESDIPVELQSLHAHECEPVPDIISMCIYDWLSEAYIRFQKQPDASIALQQYTLPACRTAYDRPR